MNIDQSFPEKFPISALGKHNFKRNSSKALKAVQKHHCSHKQLHSVTSYCILFSLDLSVDCYRFKNWICIFICFMSFYMAGMWKAWCLLWCTSRLVLFSFSCCHSVILSVNIGPNIISTQYSCKHSAAFCSPIWFVLQTPIQISLWNVHLINCHLQCLISCMKRSYTTNHRLTDISTTKAHSLYGHIGG